MKKLLVIVSSFALLSVFLLVTCSAAGTIDVSGRAGLYNRPGGGGTSAMYGLAASYGITKNISLRGALETTSYDSTTYTPISLDVIYGQDLGGGLRPYAGAGLSYNSTTTSGSTTQTTGAQAEVGISYNLGGFRAGIEYRYMFPDLNNTGTTASTYNIYATGAFSQALNI